MVPTSPFERLERFIAEQGWSQAAAAVAFGCSQGMVSMLLARHRKPGIKIASAIESHTAALEGGPIMVRDWIGAEVLKPAANGGE